MRLKCPPRSLPSPIFLPKFCALCKACDNDAQPKNNNRFTFVAVVFVVVLVAVDDIVVVVIVVFAVVV